MNTWLSHLFYSPRAGRRPSDRFRVSPHLEMLERRDAPAITVGPLINISKTAGDENENAIIVNPGNPNNLFATSTGGGVFKYTTDRGKTWLDSDISGVLGGGSQGDQQMAWDNFGNLWLTYFAGANGNTVVALSTDGGKTFQLSFDAGQLNDQPEIDAAAGYVVVDFTVGGSREVHAAPVTGLGQVGSWRTLQTGTNNGTFGDIAIGPQGQFIMVYQENNGNDAPAQMFADIDPDGLGPAGFTSVSLGVTNVGSFDTITPQPDRSVDAEMNLAWDRSGGPHNGRVYLVYTDEIPDESNDTDIFLRFSDDNGLTWSAKKRLNDDVVGNGKAQFLPAIAVDQSKGTLAVSWYDCRNSPGNNKAQIFATTSRDGGITFDANTQISQGFTDGTVNGGFNFGDYDKMTFANGVFYRIWSDNSNATGDNPDGAGAGLDMYTAACIASQPPVITSLSVDPNPITQGDVATLTGSFTDPDSPNDAFRVRIDWGDGTSPSQFTLPQGRRTFTMQHQYLFAGNKLVITVTVTDGDGNSDTEQINLTAFNVPPTAFITGAPTGLVDEGKRVALGSFVSDPNPFETFTYAWVIKKNGVEYITGTQPGIAFTPDDQGVYTAFLLVTDGGGATDAADPVTINVRNVAPKADGLTNDGPRKVGEVVHIAVLNPTDAAADVAAGLRYDFDTDGNGSYDLTNQTSATVNVTFGAENFYTLKARIRDKDGGVSAEYFTDVLISNSGGGNGGNVTTRYIAAGSDTSPIGVVVPPSTLTVFNLDGTVKYSMQPFGKVFSGGIRVATGDVNGDKTEDIIVAPGPGGGSVVKVINGADGTELLTIPNVYPTTFNKGVYVASADFNRDGFADFVVAPGAGQVAPVVAYSGFDQKKLFSINPFGTLYKGGISIAAADVDGDRRPDLVVGQATTGSQVKVFRYLSSGLQSTAYRTFASMPSTYTGGVFVAAGDLDGDRKAEVIVGSNLSLSQTSRIRVFNGANNAVVRDFLPFASYRMGVRVSAEDIDGDGKADILAAPARVTGSTGPNPRVIGYSGINLSGKFQQELTDWAFQGGVFVG